MMEFEAAESTLQSHKKVKLKRVVKARRIFGNVEVQTAGGQWKNDKKLMATNNPTYHELETNYNLRDKIMLLKRRQGTVMKNNDMNQHLTVNNSRLDNELRKLIF
jgi:hypothetical protein